MPDNPRKSSSDNSLVNPTGHTTLSTHIPLICAVAQSFLTLYDPVGCTTRRLCPWDFTGKNTGEDCLSLLQGIFLMPGLNLSLTSLELAGRFFATGATWEANIAFYFISVLVFVFLSLRAGFRGEW